MVSDVQCLLCFWWKFSHLDRFLVSFRRSSPHVWQMVWDPCFHLQAGSSFLPKFFMHVQNLADESLTVSSIADCPLCCIHKPTLRPYLTLHQLTLSPIDFTGLCFSSWGWASLSRFECFYPLLPSVTGQADFTRHFSIYSYSVSALFSCSSHHLHS